jgi:hypothetical protein
MLRSFSTVKQQKASGKSQPGGWWKEKKTVLTCMKEFHVSTRKKSDQKENPTTRNREGKYIV